MLVRGLWKSNISFFLFIRSSIHSISLPLCHLLRVFFFFSSFFMTYFYFRNLSCRFTQLLKMISQRTCNVCPQEIFSFPPKTHEVLTAAEPKAESEMMAAHIIPVPSFYSLLSSFPIWKQRKENTSYTIFSVNF